MLLEVIETFRKRSDGQILHPGDVIEVPPEKILPLIGKGAIRPIARFKVGQHVRFNIYRALNILEGVIVEKKWHGPVTGWWYRVENPGGKFWTSESHIQIALEQLSDGDTKISLIMSRRCTGANLKEVHKIGVHQPPGGTEGQVKQPS